MLNWYISVYLEDSLIFSKSHVYNTVSSAAAPQELSRKMKAEKCQFLAASVFFRYVITQGSIQMIQQRSLLLSPGHFPNPINGCNIFWGLYIFITGMYTTVLLLPLTALTSNKGSFLWTSAPEATFQSPSCGGGRCLWYWGWAVLSKRSALDQKLHPCGTFSRCLTPVDRNYNIGNWELAVKMALEEWQR